MKESDRIPGVFQTQRMYPTEAEILSAKVKDALSELVDSYLVQVKEDMIVMKQLLKRAKTATPEDRFHLIRDDFFVKVHDLKGQGATFGYPLLTELGSFACDFLRNKKEVTVKDLSVLEKISDDVDEVLTNHLTESGGEQGEAIRKRLLKGKNG